MRRLPPRVLILAAPVWVAGLALAIAAAASYASTPHGFEEVTGAFAFLLASTLASRYPVPIEGAESGGVTLSFVFGTSGIVLFGWDAGVLVALVDGSGTAVIVAQVAISATTQYALNLLLVSGAVASTARRPFAELSVSSARATVIPFALMG